MNSECSICLSIISNNNYCITNCNHTYCYNCLNGWFEKKKYLVQIVDQILNLFHIIMKIQELFI